MAAHKQKTQGPSYSAAPPQPSNKREFIRAGADLDATLRLRDAKYHVKVVDISTGGLKIESNQVLPVDEDITIDFYLANTHLILLCRIVHVLIGAATQNSFGCKFEYVKESDLKIINSYIFAVQTLLRRQSTWGS